MLITKNGVTLNVSKGAFNASFRAQGWVEGKGEEDKAVNSPVQMSPQPLDNSKADLSLDKEVDDANQEAENDDAKNADLSGENQPDSTLITDTEKDAENGENEGENSIEIPISEMTVNQLIEFADEHDIDISGLQGKAKIRAAIEESMK